MIKSQSSPGRNYWIGGVFLVLLIAVTYSSLFSAGYIWDDESYVTNNVHLRSLAGLAKIWLEPGATPQYYPLVFTVFWVEYHLWGLEPLGFHLVNILVHALNAILIWRCMRKMDIPAPFWIACLFAVHPVNLESVAWITELKNTLSMFFYLLSGLAYLEFSPFEAASTPVARRWCYFAGSLLFFQLALFSKTVAGSLPAVLLLLFWWKKGRISWQWALPLLPFFLLALVFGRNTAKLELSHVLAAGPEWDFSVLERVLIAGRAIWFYAGKLVWPYPIVFNYARWQIDSGEWWQYLFPFGIVLLVLLLWKFRALIGRGPLTGVLFFIGTLFPALGFFNLYPMRYSFVADHFQYVAGIGILALFSAVIERLFRSSRVQHATAKVLFFSTVIIIFSVTTWRGGRAYADSMALFTDVLAKNPSSWLAYSNRGRDYSLQGRDDLALADLNRALELNPDIAEVLQCRAVILLRRKEFGKCIADMSRAIELQPWRADYYRNRSVANSQAGFLVEALADAGRAIDLEPGHVETYLYRASLYDLHGEHAAAEADRNQAVRLGYRPQ